MSKKNVKSAENAQKMAAKPAATGKKPGLVAQLEHLRSTTKEICLAFTANSERDILELIELINSGNTAKKGAGKIKPAELEKAEALLSRLSVKPEKGRRTDLKKIEKTVEAMKEILGKGQNE